MTPHTHPRSTLPKPDRSPATTPPEALSRLHQRVLDAIKRRPMGKGELSSIWVTGLRAANRDAILADLVRRGLIRPREPYRLPNGRVIVEYEATENQT